MNLLLKTLAIGGAIGFTFFRFPQMFFYKSDLAALFAIMAEIGVIAFAALVWNVTKPKKDISL